MIFISDNFTTEKTKYTARSALEGKYQRIVTETVGTDAERAVDRVYRAWKEDSHGEIWDVTYMRVWFEEWRVIREISQHPPPDWLGQYQEQQAGQ